MYLHMLIPSVLALFRFCSRVDGSPVRKGWKDIETAAANLSKETMRKKVGLLEAEPSSWLTHPALWPHWYFRYICLQGQRPYLFYWYDTKWVQSKGQGMSNIEVWCRQQAPTQPGSLCCPPNRREWMGDLFLLTLFHGMGDMKRVKATLGTWGTKGCV